VLVMLLHSRFFFLMKLGSRMAMHLPDPLGVTLDGLKAVKVLIPVQNPFDF
jgi:hypothetical protein